MEDVIGGVWTLGEVAVGEGRCCGFGVSFDEGCTTNVFGG